jgi:hypothetical protein
MSFSFFFYFRKQGGSKADFLLKYKNTNTNYRQEARSRSMSFSYITYGELLKFRRLNFSSFQARRLLYTPSILKNKIVLDSDMFSKV